MSKILPMKLDLEISWNVRFVKHWNTWIGGPRWKQPFVRPTFVRHMVALMGVTQLNNFGHHHLYVNYIFDMMMNLVDIYDDWGEQYLIDIIYRHMMAFVVHHHHHHHCHHYQDYDGIWWQIFSDISAPYVDIAVTAKATLCERKCSLIQPATWVQHILNPYTTASSRDVLNPYTASSIF